MTDRMYPRQTKYSHFNFVEAYNATMSSGLYWYFIVVAPRSIYGMLAIMTTFIYRESVFRSRLSTVNTQGTKNPILEITADI